MNNNYNKSLQPFANTLRKTMTKAEACLWKYVLRANKLRGYSFCRQRPISGYIADFVCFELKLVIEVDGYSHQLNETFEKDAIKTQALNQIGFSVLRFSDNDVLKDISNVIRALELYIEEFEKIHPLPPPAGDSAKQECQE